MTLTHWQLAYVFSTLTVFIVYWMNGQRRGRNLPPGPKKYPLIGSLLSMPANREWETFAKWGKEYSPWCQWIETLILRSPLRINLMPCTHRFPYYSCKRFGDIDGFLKLVQSRHRPSRPKIQYLLQQESLFKYPFPRWIYGNPSLLPLGHILPCSMNCKFFVSKSCFEDNIEPIW
jgi:hypothetical protein